MYLLGRKGEIYVVVKLNYLIVCLSGGMGLGGRDSFLCDESGSYLVI